MPDTQKTPTQVYAERYEVYADDGWNEKDSSNMAIMDVYRLGLANGAKEFAAALEEKADIRYEYNVKFTLLSGERVFSFHDGMQETRALQVFEANVELGTNPQLYKREITNLTGEWELARPTLYPVEPLDIGPLLEAKTDFSRVQQLEQLLSDIFAALDGEGISHQYGEFRNGEPATIGGLLAFTSDWDAPVEPAWRGEPWDSLTAEQKFESSKFSAQHGLVKELAELKARYRELQTGQEPSTDA